MSNRWIGNWSCSCGASGTSESVVFRPTKTGAVSIRCPECDARIRFQPEPADERTMMPRFVSSLEVIFDTIVVINLDRRTDRMEQAEAEFKRCGVKNYIRVAGIDGVVLQGDGSAGCIKSHRKVWRSIAAGEYGDRVLIFEDDFKLLHRDDLTRARYHDDSPEVEIYNSVVSHRRPIGDETEDAVDLSDRFEVMWQYVPADWDVLYLGGGYSRPPLKRVHRHVIRNHGMLCAHSYAMTRDYAKKLVDRLERTHPNDATPGTPDAVLDALVKDEPDDHIFYTLSPRLFIQRSDTRSDLTGAITGIQFSMMDAVLENLAPTESLR